MVFHLFNFKDVIFPNDTADFKDDKTARTGYVALKSTHWQVELRSLPSTDDTIDQLRKQGGFFRTHIGRFKNVEGESFSGREAKEILLSLRYLFSFAKGMWCEPVCGVGFDKSGNRVWETWSSPRDPWDAPLSWFDRNHSEQLAAPFSGFMAKCDHEDWREALYEAIYWYLIANQSGRGIDAGIILTQAAIERLAYELVVRDRKLLSVKGFKDIAASDKFRLLFSTVGIPLDLPGDIADLKNLTKESKSGWHDAPRALTEIRNSLVHPEHKHRVAFRDVHCEAWKLGLWYLELSILAICGYAGTYGSRLRQQWVGEVEKVPWAK